MHFVLILIILMLAFPILARFVGKMLSAAFWLVAIVAPLAAVGSLAH